MLFGLELVTMGTRSEGGSSSSGLTSTGTGSDKAGISEELVVERLVGRPKLSSEALLVVEFLGRERFIGASSNERGRLHGAGAFSNARVEDDSLMAEGGSFVEDGSTIGGRGGPNIWSGGRGLMSEVTGVEWRTGEAECRLEAAVWSGEDRVRALLGSGDAEARLPRSENRLS